MNITKNVKLIVLICLCLMSISLAAFITYQYMKKNSIARSNAFTQAMDTTEQTANQINRFIHVIETEVDKLTAVLMNEYDDLARVEQELRKKADVITGSGVVTYASTGTWTGFYFVEKNGKQQMLSVSETKDAVSATQPFFEGLKNHKGAYVGPLIDPYTGESVIAYCKEVATKQGTTLIFATQSLNHLQHVLNTLYMSKEGYWFMADAKGQIIIHPRTIFTNKPTFLHDFAKLTGTPALASLTSLAQGTVVYKNEVTQQASWLIHRKIAHADWILCGVFEKLPSALDNNENRHYQMLISLSMLLSFLLLFFIILLCTTTRSHQWMATIIASGACAMTIAALWYSAKTYPNFNDDTTQRITPIENKVELYKYLDTLHEQKQTTEQLHDEQKLDYYLSYRYRSGRYIPTGTFIHYMHFVSESQVRIVGYVWQRYFQGTHDDIVRGFVLPQATSSASITEVFRTKIDREETIIWRVNATLNQKFSYTRYPFDTREISIQLWHADFGKNIILVPDLDSYPLLTVTSLPGLSSNANLPNWQFKNSYFGYQKYLYNSLFGLYTYGPFGMYNLFDKSYTPELHFVATAQRFLIDTCIDDLLPVFLIALLLFIVFITDIGHGYPVFAAYASIFFGVVVSQLNFRSKMPSHQLVYFENMYIILYLALIITLMLTLARLRHVDQKTLDYGEGKLAEILYWPTLLSMVILLTIVYLY